MWIYKYILLFVLFVNVLFSQQLSEKDLQACKELNISKMQLLNLLNKKIYQMSPDEVDKYLDYLDFTQPSLFKKVEIISQKYLGQPYDLYNLGEFPFELYDNKNLYNLKVSDCVTFVESVLAMALSYDWKSYFLMLQRIRYKNGNIGVAYRNHFSEVDWIPNNSWLVRDINSNFTGVKPVNVYSKIQKQKFLNRWGVSTPEPVLEAEWNYIKAEDAHIIIPQLRTGDLVFIVKGYTPDNATITHVGLIVVDENGTVNFIHSGKPEVQILPLIDYIKKWAPGVEDDVAPAIDQEYDEEILTDDSFSNEKSSGGTKSEENNKNKKKKRKGSLRFLGVRVVRLNDNPILNLEKIDGPNAPKLTIQYYK